MKKVLIYIIALFCLTGSAWAFNADSAFAKGNEFFQKKEFKKAIESYSAIINAGYEGSSVYYNLGNAYFREGKLGYAVLYYEKAAKLSPGDDEIIHNLKIANFRTLDKVPPIPTFFLFRFWEKMILIFSVSGWTFAAFVFYLIILVSIGIYFVSGNQGQQRISFFTGLISIILFVAALVLLSQRIGYQHDTSKGVITASTSVVKLAPDLQSKDTFVIHEGMKVRIEDKVNDWYKIKIPDGKIGWVQGTNLEII